MYLRDIPTKAIVVTMHGSFDDGTKITELDSELKKEFSQSAQMLFEARGKRKKWFDFYRTAAFDLRDVLGKSLETANLPLAEQKEAWEKLFLTKISTGIGP